MFVRYFVEIARPVADVQEVLLASPELWAGGPAGEAHQRGRRLLAEVGFEPAGHRVSKRVEICFSDPIHLPSKTILPMTWSPTGAEPLFPALDADIEIAGLGPNRTQLSMSARYTPPLGAVGRAIDRSLLHRVAEATVKDFLDRVAATLERVPAPAR